MILTTYSTLLFITAYSKKSLYKCSSLKTFNNPFLVSSRLSICLLTFIDSINYKYIYIYVCICIYIYMYMYIYVYVYIYIYICICICICIFYII